MSREWKPGDVALVNDCTRPEAPWKPATCKERGRPGQMETVWVLHDSGAKVWGSVSDARPLVVIDPEDEGQVDSLREALADAQSFGEFAAALREYANPKPPKPDEPHGLGAVVEDEDGARYTRVTGDDAAPWVKVPVDDWQVNCFEWDEFAAVRVLSPGVEVDQ